MKRKFSAEPLEAGDIKGERPARSFISEVIELSSDDDFESTAPMHHKAPVIELFDSDDEVDATTTRFQRPADQENAYRFRDWFSKTVPIRLIPKETFEYMVGAAFLRLKSAKKQDISIDRIFVDQDTLLCWDDYPWDSEQESFHQHVQHRLINLQTAIEFGPFVLDRLLYIANRRLQEAKDIGLSTNDLLLAADLCVTWQGRIEYEDIVSYDSEDGSEIDEHSDIAVLDAVPRSRKRQRKKIGDPETITVFGASFILTPSVHSDTSSDTEQDYGSEYDDEISLDNFLDPEPFLEEQDTSHIAHDVLVLGQGDDTVDLEVYLCSDNIEEIPQLELAINREGFEHYYNVEDAVDLELGFDIINQLESTSTESGPGSEAESVSKPYNKPALIVENYGCEDEVREYGGDEEDDDEAEDKESGDIGSEDNNNDDEQGSMTEVGLVEEAEPEHYVSCYADDESEISEEE